MAQAAFVKFQAREFLDEKLRAAGDRWVAQRHAIATRPGHPAVRKAMRRLVDQELADKVSALLHVYLEDLDYENAR